MAFERTFKGPEFVKARHMKKGDTITGYVVSNHSYPAYPEHVNLVVALKGDHTLPVEKKKDKDDKNPAIVPTLVTDGSTVILQGAGNLKYFFMNEPKNELGLLYQFQYEGMIVKKKGRAAGKMAHYFTTLVDSTEKFAGELPVVDTGDVNEEPTADIAF